MESIIYILLAVLGLGFLVFIHELGHYIVARRVGMKVEAFAIGFGKPIFTFERKGVKWHICMLPFGGYVKIAGMQKEGDLEPHQIKGGFFASKPFDRIKVAIMGPVVNIVFALLAFTALWLSGGREKPFSEFTKRIGWMDTSSQIYSYGVRPGDEIVDYDGKPFSGFKDLMLASVMDDESSTVQGFKINYLRQKKVPFDYSVKTYEDPRNLHADFVTSGILSPASYLIYDKFSGGEENPLFPGSPLENSGIQYGDRLFWVNGELLFSVTQLKSLLAESTAFLTVERNGKVFHSKIPRVQVDDLRLSSATRNELDDWRHEANLSHQKLQDLFFIPYKLTYNNEISETLNFIDEQDQKRAFQKCTRCAFFNPLRKGDKILAINGNKVETSDQLLDRLQTLESLVIVQRDPNLKKEVSWMQADNSFDYAFNPKDLEAIVGSIGRKGIKESGNLFLLKTIQPKSIVDFTPSKERTKLLEQVALERKEIEKIESIDQREEMLAKLQEQLRQPYLGIQLQDREVRYNPNPFMLFSSVFEETWRTMSALFSGYLSPKWLSGPVGIIQVVHHSWMIGYKEVLFWMGLISLNLGILNLLPIPVLDGGHISFSLVEMVTKKPIKAKTMERLIIPFVVLLIGLIIYVTYHDLSRIISRFF